MILEYQARITIKTVLRAITRSNKSFFSKADMSKIGDRDDFF